MKILFLIVFTLFGVGPLNAQHIQWVLQKYLEAVGGADKIRGIHSYYLNEVYTSGFDDTARSQTKQKITYYKATYTRIKLHYDGRNMITSL